MSMEALVPPFESSRQDLNDGDGFSDFQIFDFHDLLSCGMSFSCQIVGKLGRGGPRPFRLATKKLNKKKHTN